MEIQVKARPIIFSGAMVRALLAGTKTQTRRKAKHPLAQSAKHILSYHGQSEFDCIQSDEMGGIILCPYGQPGDQLWVRETWRKHYYGNGGVNAPGILYAADNATRWTPEAGDFSDKTWRPSIFMPRWASRILLEITAVRCERLQDISEADAYAEGCERQMCTRCDESGQELEGEYKSQPCSDCSGEGHFSLAEAYRRVWASINGPGSWAANPWVWVVEFKRVEA